MSTPLLPNVDAGKWVEIGQATIDTLLMLGSDFPYRNFYPTGAKVIQVDRDPGALGRRV